MAMRWAGMTIEGTGMVVESAPPNPVIPAQAGIQSPGVSRTGERPGVDSRFRGNDGGGGNDGIWRAGMAIEAAAATRLWGAGWLRRGRR